MYLKNGRKAIQNKYWNIIKKKKTNTIKPVFEIEKKNIQIPLKIFFLKIVSTNLRQFSNGNTR